MGAISILAGLILRISECIAIILLVLFMNYQVPPPPPQLRAVVYARGRDGEQPIPLTLDLRPYTPQLNENVTYVQLQNPPIQGLQQPRLILNDDAVNQTKPFTGCTQFWSGFFSLWSFGMSVSAFVFFIFIITDSLHYDKYSTSLSKTMGIVTVSLYSTNILLRIVQIVIGCNYSEIQEKLATSISLFLPGLKYHIFRLNPEFHSGLKSTLTIDTICNVIQLFAGITAEITAGNAYRWTGYSYHNDAYYILFGIFILVESGFLWPVIILTHGKWISKTLKQEKTRQLLASSELYYRMAGYNGDVQYRPID